MRLNRQQIRVLQHQLNRRIKRQFTQPRPERGPQIRRQWHASVVKRDCRPVGEVGGEDTGDFEVMGLQKPCFWHHEGNVVERSCELRAVEATGTWVCPQTNGVKKMPIDFEWDIGGKQSGVQTSELVIVGQSKIGVVGERQSGERRKDGGGNSFVLENGGDGLVVDGNGSVHEGAGGHEVAARGLISVNQNIGGLAGGNENGGGSERLCVDSVDLHDGESVAGYGEEQLVIECCVDNSEKVCFSWLYL